MYLIFVWISNLVTTKNIFCEVTVTIKSEHILWAQRIFVPDVINSLQGILIDHIYKKLTDVEFWPVKLEAQVTLIDETERSTTCFVH